MLVTQQDTMRLIRKLIFAKYSQDPTHFCRCVDEIAQTLDEQGDKEGARAIRSTSRDGYVKSYYARQVGKHSLSVAPLSATSLRSSSTTRISRCGTRGTIIRKCGSDTF